MIPFMTLQTHNRSFVSFHWYHDILFANMGYLNLHLVLSVPTFGFVLIVTYKSREKKYQEVLVLNHSVTKSD